MKIHLLVGVLLTTPLFVPLVAGAPAVPSNASAGQNALPDGKTLLKTQGCVTCHSVGAAGFQARTKSDKLKGPDLSGYTSERDFETLVAFVRGLRPLDGKKHKKPFKGSDAELQAIIDWLGSLEAQEKTRGQVKAIRSENGNTQGPEMTRGQYNPDEMPKAWASWLSTHPDPGNRARAADLNRHKASGVLGENNKGLVQVRDLNALPLQERAAVQKLVREENAGRERMFNEAAAATGTDLSQLPRIRATYAEILRDQARRGDWIQMPNGPWREKQ